MKNVRNLYVTDKGKKVIQKKSKFKLIKEGFKFLLTAAAIATAVFVTPYIQNYFATNGYRDSHTVEQVQPIVEVEPQTETYAVSPYTYDGDVKAFIEAPGIFDNVYPIMQSADNDYYLHHDVTGNYNDKGSIYKDFRNGEGLSDDLTVIYGHNLIDNSMMGKISEMADKTVGETQVRDADDLYNTANKIDYKDEYGHYEIDIFASGVYDATFVNKNVGNFANEDVFNETVKQIKEGSDIQTNITPTKGDKIVCFLTCPDMDATDYYANGSGQENNRVLVFGVAKQLEKYQELPNVQNQSHTL